MCRLRSARPTALAALSAALAAALILLPRHGSAREDPRTLSPRPRGGVRGGLDSGGGRGGGCGAFVARSILHRPAANERRRSRSRTTPRLSSSSSSSSVTENKIDGDGTAKGQQQRRRRRHRPPPPPPPTARSAALRSLALSSSSGGSHGFFAVRLLESDPSYLSLSDDRDRSFARLLVSTVERRAGQLDRVLGMCCDGRYPPKGSSGGDGGGGGRNKRRKGRAASAPPPPPDLVLAALRTGAAQLLFLDTPPYAAVKETVDALRREGRRGGGRSGDGDDDDGTKTKKNASLLPESSVKFINAVLRRVQRDGMQMLTDLTSPLDNVSPYLVAEWTDAWGTDEARKVCDAMMSGEARAVDLTVRIPPGCGVEKREEILEGLRRRLDGENIDGDGDEEGNDGDEIEESVDDDDGGGEGEEEGGHRRSVVLPQGSVRAGRNSPGAQGPVSSWPGYDDGTWWVQDVSSTLPALALHSALAGGRRGTVRRGAAEASAAGADDEEDGGIREGECDGADERYYASLKVVELKDMCRERGLPVSGTKAVLVERLESQVAALPTTIDPDEDSSDLSPSPSAAINNPANMHVVDLCAAPGGKTSQLLSFGYGRVTAVEANERRCRRLRENLDRLGFEVVASASSASKEDAGDEDGSGDGETPPPTEPQRQKKCEIVVGRGQDYFPPRISPGHPFPAPAGVLLDVPCSATGTGARNPDVLLRYSSYDDPTLKELRETQASLARHVSDNILDVGGIMVYSTCSLLRCEGEDQIEALLRRSEGGEGGGTAARMEILPLRPGEIPGFDDAIDAEKGWMRVLPGTLDGPLARCDGFFVARLIKVA